MQVHSDPRIELFSILFHLIGSPEFQPFATSYLRAVDEHFAPFREHPAALATRELRATYGIGHNAPIGLAVFLDAASLQPIVSLTTAEDLDARWQKVPVAAYLEKVRSFASESRFSEFFASQGDYIAGVERRLEQALLPQGIETWFAGFLGSYPGTRFTVVPGLLTGPWSYEASMHDAAGRERVYQVVELEGVDENGLPVPTVLTTDLIVHELAHSYVNPIVEHHAEEFKAAEALYVQVQAVMEKQRYTSWKILVQESLVRAITVLYIRDRQGVMAASEAIYKELQQGFSWITELAKQLAEMRAVSVGKPINLGEKVPTLAALFAAWAQAAAAP